MEPSHLKSLPLHYNPNGLDPCLSKQFCAMPITKSVIGLWIVHEIADKQRSKLHPIELEGHIKTINSLTFSNGSPNQLASSCCDKILLWDLSQITQSESNSKSVLHQIFCQKPGDLNMITLNNANKIIVAGKGENLLIFEKGKPNARTLPTVHNLNVSGIQFCPHYTSTLVSISDDRTCCIWDIQDSVLLFQSSILSPTPLLSLSMSSISPCVMLGSGDGKLIAIDLTNGHDFRQLANIDIPSTLRKSKELLSKQQTRNSDDDSNSMYAESSESILSIEYVYFSQVNDKQKDVTGNISGVSEVISNIPATVNLITTNHFIQFNSNTFEFQNAIDLRHPMTSETFSSSMTVGSLSYAAAKQIEQFKMFIVAGTAFDRKIHLVEWCFLNENFKSLSVLYSKASETEASADSNNNELSIVATNDFEINSPLKLEMLPPLVKNTITKGDVATGKKKSQNKMNQPLTFKSSVKSSGYAQEPRTTMFKPETNKEKLLNMTKPVRKSSKSKITTGKSLKSDNEITDWVVKDYIDAFEVDSQMTGVMNLRFSDDGSSLACALSNKSAMVIKSPYNRGICSSFVGHDASVNSVFWSKCNSYLLTASNDKTVRLWDKSSAESLLILTHKIQKPKETTAEDFNRIGLATTKTKENNPFYKEITRAQFYYMDKFLLLTHGPELSLYTYYISHEVDDLKRYQSRNKYKLVSNWTCSSSLITHSTAVNNFYSHLVLSTTSGKSIEVYDVNKSSLCHSFHDCHSRPAHCIVINEGSCFSSQSSLAYNVIATSAPSDSIKLWDLRTKSCVQALSGHQNKAHSCQITFSPCGNYLASGSEDRAAYLFDLRKGTFNGKLRGPSDACVSVAFHPGKPLLAAGCLDSKICWYK